jgi:hypothetical protein
MPRPVEHRHRDACVHTPVEPTPNILWTTSKENIRARETPGTRMCSDLSACTHEVVEKQVYQLNLKAKCS